MSGIGLVDSHCHVQQIEVGERERALDEARERGVEGFLVPALHLDDAPDLFELADCHSDVWIAIGVHPHEAKRWRDGDQRRLRGLLEHPRVVAVGECGLDFHYDLSPRAQQQRAMREQWEVAIEADLPVIVHNRDSDEEMLGVFHEPGFAALSGVFHSYCAGAAMARELLDRDRIWLGISGMVTFRAADNVREVFEFTPAERLLVETDTPYLAPVPYRGRPNRPAYVVEVAARTAAELGLSPSELAARTGAGFARLFERAGLAR
jgi:TatD DNase family protein